MKSLYHQESSLQALNVSPTMYHLTTADPRAHVVVPDPLDEQPLYYGSLVNNPGLYHSANQRYSGSGPILLGSSPVASHAASTPSPCVGARTAVSKLDEGPQVGDSYEACFVSRHQSFVQTALPLGKSPPSRYIQGPVQGKAGGRVESLTMRTHEEGAPERVTVKQENLRYAYLEDGECSYCIMSFFTKLRFILTFCVYK